MEKDLVTMLPDQLARCASEVEQEEKAAVASHA